MNVDMGFDWKATGRRAAFGVAVVSGLLSLVLAILLIATYLQLQSVDPLASPALDRLLERLEENPDDSNLQEEIRSLDLLMRKAFLTTREQIRVGGYLLLGAVVILLLSLRALAVLNRQPLLPADSAESIEPGMGEASSQESTKSTPRRAVAVMGLGIFALALVASFVPQTLLYERQASEGTTDGGTGSAERQQRSETAVAQGSTGERAAVDEPAQTAALAKEDRQELFRNWPGFRGPLGIGVAGSSEAPLAWNGETGEGVLWKTEVPLPGFGSPVVWKDRVFLSGANRDHREVYCFDGESGEILWKQRVTTPGTPKRPPTVTEDTGFAASTMVTNGKGIFAIFATGDVACFDPEGNPVWSKNLGEPDNHYGHSSSLVLLGNLLIVQYDHAAEASLMALDSRTGETVWQTARDVETSWASPILVEHGSGIQVVLNANPVVTSYDVLTGRLLWETDCMIGEVAPSPAHTGGLVFAVNQFAALCAISLDTAEVIWEAWDDLPDVSSPLAADGLLFLATSYGVVTCFDAGDGEVLWVQEFEEGFYASPILVDQRVYLMDMRGTMRIFAAGESYEPLGSPALGESTLCTPAFAGGRIYVRGEKHLYCIGEEG